MNRNTPSRGFKSPFLGINRKSALDVKQGDNNDVPQKCSKELVRSTSRILKLFDKTSATASASTDETSVDEDTASSSSTEVTNIKENIPCAKVNGDKIIFNVVYGKKSAKKHKTWEGDGSLEVTGKAAVLKDMEGAIIGRTTVNPIALTEGARIFMGNKEIEIIEAVTDIDRTTDDLQKKEIVEPPLKRPRTEVSRRYTPVISSGLKLDYKPLVMPRPSAEVQWAAEEAKDPQEVSVDPCLAMVLRPHQRYGTAFLYQCVMGMKKPDCYGAILADEMGLGKTLQCVALIWTLLKKGPYGKPVLKHVLVIAPSSLCDNWKKEFIRWLGRHRISPFVVDAKKKPGDFARLVRTPVMIVSYEMFVRCYEDINAIEFDLLICDEGHRLKNSAVKASKLLVRMNCKRRILLTGTPVQNDLREFYTLVDLVNPGVLDCNKSYKARYEDPILASRCPNASEDVLSLGEERARELNEYTKFFILRRTHETLKEYLPTKHEVVVFCRLSLQQEKLYTLITDQWFDGTIHSKGTVSPLTIITVLKKICNHVSLVKNDMSDLMQKLDPNVINCSSNRTSREYSGKLTAVRALLTSLKKSSEKLVLVSYFTRTLDLLEGLCEAENLSHLRLDGNTPTALRMNTVEKFNANNDQFRVFLLSAKAGGTGLNLSGASRLVLFDSDWNPASDAQAMARIWRDGQKKSVYIYRFITSGTIEEKIFQRQISKTGLSEAVVSPNNASLTKLTINELKDLFTLNRDTSCLTHDLMKCPCTGRGDTGNEKEEKRDAQESRDSQFTLKDEQTQQYLTINQLLHWQHYGQPLSRDFLQELMLSEVSEHINFVIKNA